MQLSQANFAQAVHFINTAARRLDQLIFAYHFQDGSAEAVLDELARYQNEDGGFGRALEPDFRLESSSPLASTVALQIIQALPKPVGQPMVNRAIGYLLTAFDDHRGYWPAVPEAINQVPHAPWWTFDPAKGGAAPETPANPSAEVVGYLHIYPHQVRPDFLALVTERVIAYLADHAPSLSMFELRCYQRLVKALPQPEREQVAGHLQSAILNLVEPDPAAWAGYVAQPLEFVHSPQSPLYQPLRQAVEANLDYTIEAQVEDGSWPPKWSWGEDYSETWPTARQEWAGHLTVETLTILKAFGRLEAPSIS